MISLLMTEFLFSLFDHFLHPSLQLPSLLIRFTLAHRFNELLAFSVRIMYRYL
jgi:hypothetical protein